MKAEGDGNGHVTRCRQRRRDRQPVRVEGGIEPERVRERERGEQLGACVEHKCGRKPDVVSGRRDERTRQSGAPLSSPWIGSPFSSQRTSGGPSGSRTARPSTA
jgi:hypothetical protein